LYVCTNKKVRLKSPKDRSPRALEARDSPLNPYGHLQSYSKIFTNLYNTVIFVNNFFKRVSPQKKPLVFISQKHVPFSKTKAIRALADNAPQRNSLLFL